MGVVELSAARELAKELADAIQAWIDGDAVPSAETIVLWQGHAGAIALLLADDT